MERMTTDHLERCRAVAESDGSRAGRELAAAIAAAIARRKEENK